MLATPWLDGDKPPSPFAHRGIGPKFTSRVDDQRVEFTSRPLIGNREMVDAINLIAPHIDSNWRVGGGWEYVDDAAADGDLTPMLHLKLAVITHGHEISDKRRRIEVRTSGNPNRLEASSIGAEPLQQRADWSDNHEGWIVTIEAS